MLENGLAWGFRPIHGGTDATTPLLHTNSLPARSKWQLLQIVEIVARDPSSIAEFGLLVFVAQNPVEL